MSPPIPRMAMVACSVPEGEIGLHSAGAAHIAQEDAAIMRAEGADGKADAA